MGQRFEGGQFKHQMTRRMKRDGRTKCHILCKTISFCWKNLNGEVREQIVKSFCGNVIVVRGQILILPDVKQWSRLQCGAISKGTVRDLIWRIFCDAEDNRCTGCMECYRSTHDCNTCVIDLLSLSDTQDKATASQECY